MDPCDPSEKDFRVCDIAHALAMKCRFNGHCRAFYSVAQHSVLCAEVARRSGADARWALLHDAAEAYLCDVPRPLKRRLVGFEEMEQRILLAVARWLDLPEEIPAAVMLIDDQMLAYEWSALMVGSSEIELAEVPPCSPVLDLVIESWSPEEAARRFTWMFHRVFGG